MKGAYLVLDYTRLGYLLRRPFWNDSDLAVDLSGRHVVVTGANAGLGYCTTHALAHRGADVTMVCRHPGRAETAREALARTVDPERLSVERCDVSDLADAARLSRQLRERGRPIDVLIHNAGVMLDERCESAQGIEMTLATNVLSGFLLTHELLPILSPRARVIHVTSGGMYTQRLKVDDLEWKRPGYDGVVQYAQTKRAQVILNEQWAGRLPPGITSNAMHPGWAATPGVARSLPNFERLTKPLLRSADEGADTTVWLAASEAAAQHNGKLFFDRTPRRTHLLPHTRSPEADREALWTQCEAWVAPFRS